MVIAAGTLLPILEVGPTFETSPVASATEPAEYEAKIPARLATLGCKVNQYETQYVRELLQANGFRDAGPGEAARLAVVNTCTVTAESDSKSRQLVRQLQRDNPGIQIVVMGCYATRDAEAVRRLPGVAAVITDKTKLEAELRPFGVSRQIRGIRDFNGHQRAFVKVQDGCILDCAFCIIPTVRPGIRSRLPEDIESEVKMLVANGYREIVLTGIHLGHYGIDLSQGLPKRQWQRLWRLLERLTEIDGEFRIRLSSLESTEVTDELIRVLTDRSDRICPHLHLSMQSGSDRILKAMKRRYRIGRFFDRCDVIRGLLDEPAFTTDVIVGFPGESESDFQATLNAVERVGFSKVHVFPFSARKGTAAAGFSGAVDPQVIQIRRRALHDVAAGAAKTYHQKLIGRRLEMLIESPDPQRPGIMRGTACRYAPLRLRALPALARQLAPVTAVRLADGAIEVEPAHESK